MKDGQRVRHRDGDRWTQVKKEINRIEESEREREREREREYSTNKRTLHTHITVCFEEDNFNVKWIPILFFPNINTDLEGLGYLILAFFSNMTYYVFSEYNIFVYSIIRLKLTFEIKQLCRKYIFISILFKLCLAKTFKWNRYCSRSLEASSTVLQQREKNFFGPFKC